jgi:ribosomal protein S6
MAEDAQGSVPSTQAPAADTKPVYEAGFHIVPSIPEEGVSAVVAKIRELLGDAEIISEGAPQKTTLAYTIERASQGTREKFNQSYFGWLKFATDREYIEPLQASLRGMSEVLRFIVIETVREEAQTPRRAIFSSDRLEGKTIEKHTEAEKGGAVSEEQLDKSLDALTG